MSEFEYNVSFVPIIFSKGFKIMNQIRVLLGCIVLLVFAACAPEVGSVEWCEDMDEKAKGDWSTNEATEYAKSCVFRQRDDD